MAIAVTLGDPAGVGPEIVARLFTEPRVAARDDAFVIGDIAALAQGCRAAGVNLDLTAVSSPEEVAAAPGRVNVLQVGELKSVPIGRVDPAAGAAAYRYVTRAIELALDGRISAMVTAPINKEALVLGGAPHHDHTSTLAALTGSDDVVMMLADGDFRVALVTIHVPLRTAIDLIDIERVHHVISVVHRELGRLGLAAPRIAVAGLNPHAGEGGLFGVEERISIVPAIERARAAGIDASGPWPGDAVFRRAYRGEFDAVVAQYHDQGLIPLKMVGFDHGVNVTLGLPFVRTSVDHGTAFDIAGTGTASHTSLLAAFDLAVTLTNGGR